MVHTHLKIWPEKKPPEKFDHKKEEEEKEKEKPTWKFISALAVLKGQLQSAFKKWALDEYLFRENIVHSQ